MIKQKNILINYCLYFIFLLIVIIIGSSNVLAYTYSEIANVTNKTTLLVEPSYSNSPFTVPVNSSYNFNSVKKINIIVDNYSFQANTNYQLEFALTNQTLEYANTMGVIGANGEVCKMDANASLLSGSWLYFAFQCTQATSTITIEVKNINNTDLWSGSGIFSWDKSVLRSAPEPIGTTPTDTDNIINNQNANTQSIIDTQKVCHIRNVWKNTDISTNKYLANDGTLVNSTTSSVSDFLSVIPNTQYNFTYTSNSSATAGRLIILYDKNKNIISSFIYSASDENVSIVTTSNTYFVRITFANIFTNISVKGNECKNGNQANNDAINDLNDTLNDDSIDTSDATSFFDNFTDNTHGLSGIISAPLIAVNSMLNDQCSPLTASWKGKQISFDCGYTFWGRLTGFKSFLNIAIDGLLCYRILLKIFKLIERFKNPTDDRVEVMDL